MHRCVVAQTWSVVQLSSASGSEDVAFGDLVKDLSDLQDCPTRSGWMHGGACGLGLILPRDHIR